VASRPAARPGPTAPAHLVVFYERGDIQLRIPLDAVAPPRIGQPPRTKLTSVAVEEFLSTARGFGACLSPPTNSGELSPTTCARRSPQT
jgi:hypothetical protein